MILYFVLKRDQCVRGAEHQMAGAAETYDGGAVTALRFLTQA